MQKALLSLGLSILLCVLVVAAVQMQRSGGGDPEVARQLSAVDATLGTLREDLRVLSDRIRSLELNLPVASGPARVPESGASATEGGASVSAVVPAVFSEPDALKSLLIAAISEERAIREKQQAQEREQQREEARQRFAERRQEMEQLRQGPYDRYNLKVNSMAKVLGLTEGQKQQFFELSKAYSDKLQAGREQLRAQIAAAQPGGQPGQQAADGQGPGRRPGRMGGERGQQYRELSDGIQKEYAAQVAAILTVAQQDVYSQLSEQSKSIQNLDEVTAPGEEPQRGFFGAGGPGGFPGGGRQPGGGRPQGGGRAGR